MSEQPEPSRWTKLWVGANAGQTNPEPEVTPEPASYEPPAVLQGEQSRSAMRPDVFIGYVMAAIAPMVGVLVGVALIAKDEPSGPSVVGWSVGSAVIWAAVLGLLYGLVGSG